MVAKSTDSNSRGRLRSLKYGLISIIIILYGCFSFGVSWNALDQQDLERQKGLPSNSSSRKLQKEKRKLPEPSTKSVMKNGIKASNDTPAVGAEDSTYLQCEFNQPYPRSKHTCEANTKLNIPYCHMDSVTILIDNIEVSKGNESVADVMGRTDEAEIPVYKPGTFLIDRPLAMEKGFKRGDDAIFYMDAVLQATEVRPERDECTVKISGPVLLLTRYEYCNLYHTMTDWFNTFFSLPHPSARVTIIFLDGHARGSLDPVWPQVFGPTHFIKSFPSGTRLCLEDVTFIPAGYTSPLWTRDRSFPFPRCPEMMDAFLHRFLGAYDDVLETKMIPGLVTIVGRKPYLAHPRSVPNKLERTVSNIPELANMIKGSRIVYFESMTMKEQLKAIRESHVLIANHGAALTHLLFLHDGATVMEFVAGGTPMFDDMAAWRPTVQRTLLPFLGNSPIQPHVMKKTVSQVLEVISRA